MKQTIPLNKTSQEEGKGKETKEEMLISTQRAWQRWLSCTGALFHLAPNGRNPRSTLRNWFEENGL